MKYFYCIHGWCMSTYFLLNIQVYTSGSWSLQALSRKPFLAELDPALGGKVGGLDHVEPVIEPPVISILPNWPGPASHPWALLRAATLDFVIIFHNFSSFVIVFHCFSSFFSLFSQCWAGSAASYATHGILTLLKCVLNFALNFLFLIYPHHLNNSPIRSHSRHHRNVQAKPFKQFTLAKQTVEA